MPHRRRKPHQRSRLVGSFQRVLSGALVRITPTLSSRPKRHGFIVTRSGETGSLPELATMSPLANCRSLRYGGKSADPSTTLRVEMTGLGYLYRRTVLSGNEDTFCGRYGFGNWQTVFSETIDMDSNAFADKCGHFF